ncbi:MAG: hypothetical protein FP824_06505 [Euryarchaeota archaeon]|nr:hypothetical protein [Euryarchaeota archaeon]
MKCPRCDNPKICKDGFSRGKYILRRQYKCYKCGKRVSELIPEKSNLNWLRSSEYARTMSSAQQLRYKEATADERQEWKDAIKVAKAAKSSKSAPKGKSRFIGMLDDIEVYELKFSCVGRPPKNIPDGWAGPSSGKPELKVRKPG